MRPVWLPQPVAFTDDGLVPNLGLLEAVRGQRHTIAELGNGVSRTSVIAQFAQAFPALRIGVVAPSWEKVQRLFTGLSKLFGSRVRLAPPDGDPETELVTGDIVVDLTLESLNHAFFDIVIFSHAICACRNQSLILCQNTGFLRAHMVGLIGIDEARSLAPADRDLLASWFGFSHHYLHRPDRVVRPAHVEILRARGASNLRPDSAGLALKRSGLWHCSARNERIREIALHIVRGTWDRNLPVTVPAVPRVAIATENAEHAVALGRLLPEWKLPFVARDLPSLTLPDRAFCKERTAAPNGHLTILPLYADWTGIDADVVIRADGLPPGCADLRFKFSETSSVHTGSPGRPLLLLDFDDRHHRTLRAWSDGRQREYGEWGFSPMSGGMQPALSDFLRRHPAIQVRREPSCPTPTS